LLTQVSLPSRECNILNLDMDLLKIIPDIMNLIQISSPYNLICGRLSMVNKFSQHWFKIMSHRFNVPELYHYEQVDLKDHQRVIKMIILYMNDLGLQIDGLHVDSMMEGFLGLKLDITTADFFVWLIPYFYSLVNSNITIIKPHYAETGFTHFVMESRNNPIIGKKYRDFLKARIWCLRCTIDGYMKSSTLEDANCIVKTNCLHIEDLFLVKKFIDYPHIFRHSKKIIGYNWGNIIMNMIPYFQKDETIIPIIYQSYLGKKDDDLYLSVIDFVGRIEHFNCRYIPTTSFRSIIKNAIDEIGHDKFLPEHIPIINKIVENEWHWFKSEK